MCPSVQAGNICANSLCGWDKFVVKLRFRWLLLSFVPREDESC